MCVPNNERGIEAHHVTKKTRRVPTVPDCKKKKYGRNCTSTVAHLLHSRKASRSFDLNQSVVMQLQQIIMLGFYLTKWILTSKNNDEIPEIIRMSFSLTSHSLVIFSQQIQESYVFFREILKNRRIMSSCGESKYRKYGTHCGFFKTNSHNRKPIHLLCLFS